MKNRCKLHHNRRTSLWLPAIVMMIAMTISSLQAATVAYWRFEAGPDGSNVIHSASAGVFSADVPDSSGSGNDLSVWDTGGGAGYAYRSDVPWPWVPQSRDTNLFSVQNTGGSPAMFTSSNAPIHTISPLEWTIEAAFQPELTDSYRTMVGRDSRTTALVNGDLAALYFQIQPDESLAIKYCDVSGYWHEAISAANLVQGFAFPDTAAGQWQAAAAVCDGSTLSLYYKNIENEDAAYTLVAQTDLTLVGSPNTALTAGAGSGGDWTAGTWTVGRGLYAGGHGDRAWGFIDEVRISDSALAPTQFLFSSPTVYVISGPNPASQVAPLGGMASISIVAGGENPTFQWRHDGTNLVGQTSATLTINPVTAASAGTYDVVIANSFPSAVTSSVATVSVHVPRNLQWAGVASNLWDSVTANWTTNAGGSYLAYVETDNVLFDPLGGGNASIDLNGTHTPSSVVVSNASYTFTNGVLGGLGSLTVKGGASLLLGTANTYGGNTTISGGSTLKAGIANSIPGGVGKGDVSLDASSTLDLAGFADTVNGLTAAGAIDNTSTNTGGATLTVGNNDQPVSLTGTITNSGLNGVALVKVGSGNMTLSGNSLLSSGAASQVNGGTATLSGTVILPTAEFWIGQGATTGSVVVAGGSLILSNNWLAIGRANAAANGTLTVQSGAVVKGGANGNIVLGSLGGTGTLNVNGGQVLNSSGLFVGEGSTGNGYVNLNGGLLQATGLRPNDNGGLPSNSVVNLNGGILQASTNNADYISTNTTINIQAGGAVIDSHGFNISINQGLSDPSSSGGGLTKLGTGTLRLGGQNAYSGSTVVSNGTLAVRTDLMGSVIGGWTVADGAELLVAVPYQDASMYPSSLKIGSLAGATVSFDLGTFGNPTYGPPLYSFGELNVNGANTINIGVENTLSVGTATLIAFSTRTGSGTFVLGTLPPGVGAYLANNLNSIDLVITNVALPRWEGLAGGTWDVNVTTNWIDRVTALPLTFSQGAAVVFDDQAAGTTAVNVVANVTPGGILVSNYGLSYSFSGSGTIGGGSGLAKLGTGSLTISNASNPYSGATLLDGGGTLVSTAPNNLGSGSDLVIGTGTLNIGTNNQAFDAVTLTNGTIAGAGATVTASSYRLDNGSISAVLAGGSLTTFGTNTDTVSLAGANTYTGRTVLGGSQLLVTNLANGGAPSGIGASSADPTNLVFSGGALRYSGPAVAIDRGYSVAGGGVLSLAGDVKVAGPVVATSGNFTKQGSAALTYSRLGTNVLSSGGYYIQNGTVVMDGGASTPTNYLQVNTLSGEVWVGSDKTNSGSLVLTNTRLNIGSWLAIDRGNGAIGNSSVTLHDSILNCGNMSIGYDAGDTNNNPSSVLNLLGDSRLTCNAQVLLAEGPDADATVNISGTSSFTVNGGWFSIGIRTNCHATVTLSGTARLSVAGNDFNISDLAGSVGTLVIQDNATNLIRTLYCGKAANTVGTVNMSGGYFGRQSGGGDWRLANTATATGIFNLSGGIFEPVQNFQIGAYGTGIWNQSGGVANCANYPGAGRFVGSTGTMTVSGGVFNQTGGGNLLIIGENGTGTLTVTNTGVVNCIGGLSIGHAASGTGVVNIATGGTVSTRLVQSPGASTNSSGILNLNGGTLKANANNANFMTNNLTAANILAAGAIVDTATYDIGILQPLQGVGGVTKNGAGTLNLNGVNTYTGATVVNGGALGGAGVISGPVVVASTGVLAPGASLGTLTINNDLTLQGGMLVEVDTSASPSNDVVVVSGVLQNTGSGTVQVANLGPSLVVGDRFYLFNKPVTGGAALTVVGANASWQNDLAVNGSIVVTALAGAPTLNFTNLGGGVGQFDWTGDYTLQWQTNLLSVGLNTNWMPYPNQSKPVNYTNNPALPATFFRLSE